MCLSHGHVIEIDKSWVEVIDHLDWSLSLVPEIRETTCMRRDIGPMTQEAGVDSFGKLGLTAVPANYWAYHVTKYSVTLPTTQIMVAMNTPAINRIAGRLSKTPLQMRMHIATAPRRYNVRQSIIA